MSEPLGEEFVAYCKMNEEKAIKFRKARKYLLYLQTRLEHKETLTALELEELKKQLKEQINSL